jgi:UDP-N-acetylmuramoyl-L-alanyl-D-glutamate--2,6-diaminopimelate ligase
VIAGKGHETYQIVGTQVLPFDDRQVVREILAELRAPR